MNKTDISWCDYSWNPITGCKRGCWYCYAERIHNRFNLGIPFSDIIEHENRFKDPGLSRKRSRIIFVGSMSGIEYWTEDQLKRVVDICKAHLQHTFMFSSKCVKPYLTTWKWPTNCMQGLTLDCEKNTAFDISYMDEMLMETPRPFLNFEPLLGPIPNLCNPSFYAKFEMVIVGAMTGPGKVIPKKEWIKSVLDNVPSYKIHWKPNIREYLQ